MLDNACQWAIVKPSNNATNRSPDMTTALQIAVIRAKMIARRDFSRAVSVMTAVGITLADAIRFVLAVLRMQRTAKA